MSLFWKVYSVKVTYVSTAVTTIISVASYQGKPLASKQKSKELEWRVISKSTVSWTL